MTKQALLGMLSLSLLMTAACSNGGGEGPKPSAAPEKPKDPVTLKVFQYLLNITDEEFQDLMAKPVKAKFPHITLELVRKTDKVSIEDLINSGEFPDMMFQANFDIHKYTPLGLAENLDPFVAKYKFDLSKYQDNIIDSIRDYGPKKELYILPLWINLSATYYNRDIFDRFGVPYPKDGMTWEELVELGRKMTRVDAGQQYVGLDLNAAPRLAASLLLPWSDPKSGTAKLTTDAWRDYFDMWKTVKEIPGNKNPRGIYNAFEKDKNLAMFVAYNRINELEALRKQGTAPNWDVVTFPSRKAEPGVIETNIGGLMMSTVSKHKDEAFQVMTYLTELENEKVASAKYARRPAIKDPEASKNFGAEMEALKGKNVQALLKMKSGKNPPPTIYEEIIKASIDKYYRLVIDGKSDINTALRQAEEEANAKIAAEQKK